MQSILFISVMNGDSWGGSEEQWYQPALYFRNKGIKVGVCLFYWKEKEDKLQTLEDAGCTLYLLKGSGTDIVSTIKNKISLSSIPYNEYEFAYVNQGGWHDVTHGAFKYLFKKLPPYGLGFHNYQLGGGLKQKKSLLLKMWIANAKICIADSRMIFKMLEDEYHIIPKNQKVFYCPLTIPIDSIDAKMIAKPFNKIPVFLFLAALDVNRKAQDILIKSFANDTWRNRQWRLNLYGRGKDYSMLEALIKSNSLENHVFLMGHTSDVMTVIQASDLLIQATLVDAMPVSVMEAMAMGTPCLVSKVGDMPDWISDGYNGFVTEEVSVDGLREKLETIWQSRDQWQQMGANARQTFLEKYPQPFQEKFYELLENALRER